MPDLHISNMCLDSAMDNYPTYNLLKDRHIHAFIDLNAKCGRPKSIPDNILIRTELLSANRENAWLPMAMTKPVVVFYGDVLMVKTTVLNVSTIVGGLLTPTSFKKVKCFIIL